MRKEGRRAMQGGGGVVEDELQWTQTGEKRSDESRRRLRLRNLPRVLKEGREQIAYLRMRLRHEV